MTVYYPLGSLNNALYKNRVIPSTRRIIVQFAREVSQAVEFMHSNGFAHCDLKPHNVFVDQLLPMYADRLAVYQCKLADFGLVQVLDERHSYVKAYDFMSMRGLTISYAAPETIQRFRKYIKMEPKDIRYTAGDVYSLSMMLFELVESRLAWHKAKVVNQ
jgi:serine/threonine protein kinase